MKAKVSFRAATIILSKLLEGKTPKQAAFEAEVSYSRVNEVKDMFPLFLGLKRPYRKAQDAFDD